MPSTQKNKTRWARRKEARPHELLTAALDLFVERGYATTRLDDVAARAGVSKGTLYLYFENKEELFKAVVRENLLPTLDVAEQVISHYSGTSTDLFRVIMMNWWERVGNTNLSGITKLMMSESGNFPEVAQFYHDEVISRANAMLTSILERGIAQGEFRPIDTTQATSIVIAPMLMLMLWKHSFNSCCANTIEPDTYLKCYLDLLLNGLVCSKKKER